IGLVAPLPDVLHPVTVFFLAVIYHHGPLSVSRRFLVPVLRHSIVELPMLLLRLVGYAIYYVSCTLLYLPLRFFIQYLSCNPVQHQRTKHIEIYIHFVRDLVAAGQVRVFHVPSRYQYADIFTKGLPSALFEEFCSSLSVWCHPAQTAELVVIKAGLRIVSSRFSDIVAWNGTTTFSPMILDKKNMCVMLL
ncbi:ribonuclease H-like domain-containing protein, partial [Tanacetum coccineum]